MPSPAVDYTSLASISATRAVLDQFELEAKYSFGQNFLVNDGVLQKIIALADVRECDTVLEVGPGIGTLTRALLNTGARVLSIEYDADLPPVLAQTCEPWKDAFTLIQADALRVTPHDLSLAAFTPTKLVSNLPYEVAATVVLQYFQTFPSIQSMTFMVQREVADRMTARPGSKDYGAYTVKLSLYAQPAGRFEVPAANFYPAPRVQSAVLRLDRAQQTAADGHALTQDELASATLVVDAAFATRRKTIVNSAKAYFANAGDADGAKLAAFVQALDACGIARTVRGEVLTPQDFIALGQAFQNATK